MKVSRKIAACMALVLFVTFAFTIQAGAASKKPSLSKTKLKLYAGRSYTLKAKGFAGKVTWKSSNKKIATVSSKGKVTAKKKGKVKITAKYGKVKKTCNVTVLPVKLNKTKLKVIKGKTAGLTLKCGATKGIKWKTSDQAVVRIKSKSKNKVTLEAVGPGKATVTAVYKKKSYKCVITVLYAITIDAGGCTGIYGKYYYPEDTILYLDGSAEPFQYDSLSRDFDTVTTEYSISDKTKITVTVKTGRCEPGLNPLKCSYSITGDKSLIGSVEFTNNVIGIEGLLFATNGAVLLHTHADGSISRHVLLNSSSAWEQYHRMYAQNKDIDTILQQMRAAGNLALEDTDLDADAFINEEFAFSNDYMIRIDPEGEDEKYKLVDHDKAWEMYHACRIQNLDMQTTLNHLKANRLIS